MNEISSGVEDSHGRENGTGQVVNFATKHRASNKIFINTS